MLSQYKYSGYTVFVFQSIVQFKVSTFAGVHESPAAKASIESIHTSKKKPTQIHTSKIQKIHHVYTFRKKYLSFFFPFNGR